MRYGNLTVYCGPMFSGKSTSLLQQAKQCLFYEIPINVYKPSVDDRYGEDVISTHSGLKVNAFQVRNEADILVKFESLYFFDEIQFFEPPYFNGDLPAIIRKLLAEGNDVYAAGLDMDWQGIPFSVTASLLAMADTVHKLPAICSVTGLSATKTYKVVHDDKRIEIGNTNKYEARNNLVWQGYTNG